jgi:hypothetical protein
MYNTKFTILVSTMFGFQSVEINDSFFLMPGCTLNIPDYSTQLDMNERIRNLEVSLD